MHDLFCSPELVASILKAAAIVSSVSTDHALLQVCLQVNRLFSHEATRLLWKRCGTGFPYSFSEPTVHALANIAAQGVCRAQYHANHIRELRFVRHGEDWPKATESAPWHDCLMDLNFPVLESFTSDKRSEVVGSPLHALRTPGPFYDFRCPERGGLFWHVLRSSPKLKAIHLALDEPDIFGDIDEEAIAFIKSTPALSSLSLNYVYEDGKDFRLLPDNFWQPGLLSSLGALPVFRKLQGMHLNANSLQDLPDDSFPALKELATNYTGSTAVLLARFPYLSVLNLKSSEPISLGLGRLADLSHLTCLDIEFAEDSNSVFSGRELIALANGVTSPSLSLGSAALSPPSCVHFLCCCFSDKS